MTVLALYTIAQTTSNQNGTLLLQTLTAITGSALLLAPTYPNIALSLTALCLYLPLLFSLYKPDFLKDSIISIGTLGATSYATFIAAAYTTHKKQKLWATLLLAGTSLGCFYMWRLSTHNTPEETSPQKFENLAIITAISWGALGFFWLLGITYKQHQRTQQTMRARAEMSAIVERTRIAREMHDIIAHSLSGIIAQADGARYASRNNLEVAQEALNSISTSARQSLKEMRGLLTLLRNEDSRPENSAPTTESIRVLIDDAQNNGLLLDVTGIDSIPHDLPELTQFTLYRIIQEILTNMLKYSFPKQGTLLIQTTPREITITSSNPAESPTTQVRPNGYGLIGIEERLKAQQGTLAYRHASTNFTLSARLPR